MKKSILIMLCLCISTILMSCEYDINEVNTQKSNVIDTNNDPGFDAIIITDTETGVDYIVVKGHSNKMISITPRLSEPCK